MVPGADESCRHQFGEGCPNLIDSECMNTESCFILSQTIGPSSLVMSALAKALRDFGLGSLPAIAEDAGD